MSNTQGAAGSRIAALLDANSFVEIGAQVTARNSDFNLNAKTAPSDGVVTGYGTVDGSLVYVYSQDASVLGGTIVGTHEVIFAGEDELITFEHTAYSRKLFAKGALEAAKFLAGKEPGMYDMQDVI